MKKQLAAGLACLLLLTGCAKSPATEDTTPTLPRDNPGYVSAYGGAGNRTAGDREGPQLCQSSDWRGPERSL